LSRYISWIGTILRSSPSSKPFIISIAASSAQEVIEIVKTIQQFRSDIQDQAALQCRIGIELNTSCPNIPGSPPKGYVLYSDETMLDILRVLADAFKLDETLTIGLKLPPYIYREQFTRVLEFIRQFTFTNEGRVIKCPFAFLTSTNTLGNTLLFGNQTSSQRGDSSFALPTVLGGLAGEALHPLSLGNVYTFSELLKAYDAESGLKNLSIIGVGGVTSKEAAERMMAAGASIIGCATLLGREGVRAFEIVTSPSNAAP
jgi:dihydroorotate dehydrogenase (fumarate)